MVSSMSDPIKKTKRQPVPAGMPRVSSKAAVDSSSPPQAGQVAGRAGKETAVSPVPKKIPEIGGPSGPEPTRYGDWERKGRCIDF